MPDGDLTKNFSVKEFTVSDRFPDVADEIIFSIDDQIKAFYMSRIVLQPLRDTFEKSIKITSGKRSVELNRLVGGVATSDHLWKDETCAVDFKFYDYNFNKNNLMSTFRMLKDKFKTCVGQVIFYRNADLTPRHIHLSLPSKNHFGEFLFKEAGSGFHLLP